GDRTESTPNKAPAATPAPTTKTAQSKVGSSFPLPAGLYSKNEHLRFCTKSAETNLKPISIEIQ
ncbi:MAG: hypothetical protein J6D43_10760, partial [Pseudomonas sp.]|nr:hypothetical protein [Pseudomonas sp.]